MFGSSVDHKVNRSGPDSHLVYRLLEAQQKGARSGLVISEHFQGSEANKVVPGDRRAG